MSVIRIRLLRPSAVFLMGARRGLRERGRARGCSTPARRPPAKHRDTRTRPEGAAFPRDAHDPQPHLVRGFQPRTAELVDKPSRPDSPVLLAARLVYELHTVFLPMVCIACISVGWRSLLRALRRCARVSWSPLSSPLPHGGP